MKAAWPIDLEPGEASSRALESRLSRSSGNCVKTGLQQRPSPAIRCMRRPLTRPSGTLSPEGRGEKRPRLAVILFLSPLGEEDYRTGPLAGAIASRRLGGPLAERSRRRLRIRCEL